MSTLLLCWALQAAEQSTSAVHDLLQDNQLWSVCGSALCMLWRMSIAVRLAGLQTANIELHTVHRSLCAQDHKLTGEHMQGK